MFFLPTHHFSLFLSFFPHARNFIRYDGKSGEDPEKKSHTKFKNFHHLNKLTLFIIVLLQVIFFVTLGSQQQQKPSHSLSNKHTWQLNINVKKGNHCSVLPFFRWKVETASTLFIFGKGPLYLILNASEITIFPKPGFDSLLPASFYSQYNPGEGSVWARRETPSFSHSSYQLPNLLSWVSSHFSQSVPHTVR